MQSQPSDLRSVPVISILSEAMAAARTPIKKSNVAIVARKKRIR
jgi:hypothetical protein